MRIDNVKIPESSFLSVEKDMELIINSMLKNERLKRLLHYTTKDALNRPNLTEDETYALIGKNIKNVPKLYVDTDVNTYVVINFDNFVENSNPEFRDNMIEFDIVCHFNQWNLKDFALRPYKIAAELDSMFNNKRLTGIGLIKFIGASQIVLTDEYACLCVIYKTIHGEEDKKNMPNPNDEPRFIEDFKEMNK